MSYPISLLLDKILGEELGAYYNRERLKELIKVPSYTGPNIVHQSDGHQDGKATDDRLRNNNCRLA